MSSFRQSTRSLTKKTLALILLLVFGIIEFGLVSYAFANGIHALGLPTFIFMLWNAAFCIAAFVFILSKGRPQHGGYMEVSNYINLNKIAKDK